jgi:hypothetical protein
MDGKITLRSGARRPLIALVAAVCASLLLAGLPGAATADSSPATATQSKQKRHGKKRHRVGGQVRTAWPLGGHRPADRLARWLARQVGPTCPKRSKSAKRKHRVGKCKRLQKRGRVKRGAKAATLPLTSADRGPKRYSTASRAKIDLTQGSPLALTRSYLIPSDDPSYKRLLNWAWTYDSAVSAGSFVADGERDQAEQLLDQLAALQFNDGSIDIAFDVATGSGAGTYRAGTIAWTGLAFTKFDRRFGKPEYRRSAERAADYLLSLQGEKGNGLVAGGPGIPWYSTQHNLLAYFFLSSLSADLKEAGDEKGAARYGSAASEIREAIDANLLVKDDSGTHFIQGLGDNVVPFDVQAYGAMYLQTLRDEKDGVHVLDARLGGPAEASEVLDYAAANFAASKRSIVKSTDEATYNDTYSADGPFEGFRPYAEQASPDVLWFEATPMLREATASLGADTTTLDGWIEAWTAILAKQGGAPLQVNQTVTDSAYGVEYHVWPAAAPAAWVLLSRSDPTFFSSP